MNQGTIIDTRPWSMDSVVPVQKRKLLRRRTRVYLKFSSRLKSQMSSTLTIRWHLVNPVKIYHGIVELPHSLDLRRLGLRKERYAEQKKEVQQYCCNLQLIHRQTDTAQLYKTHLDSCTHMDRTGPQFNLSFVSLQNKRTAKTEIFVQ